jgi:hypothetical protein
MPFTPISLPIQQILMTNFVTDIATITNANTLLLQAKLEDLINDLRMRRVDPCPECSLRGYRVLVANHHKAGFS